MMKPLQDLASPCLHSSYLQTLSRAPRLLPHKLHLPYTLVPMYAFSYGAVYH
jgi:hypothetical protein